MLNLDQSKVYFFGYNYGILGRDTLEKQNTPQLITFFDDKNIVNIFPPKSINEELKENILKVKNSFLTLSKSMKKDSKLSYRSKMDVLLKENYETYEEVYNDLKSIQEIFLDWIESSEPIKEIEDEIIYEFNPSIWKNKDKNGLFKFIEENIQKFRNSTLFKEMEFEINDLIHKNEDITKKQARKQIIERIIENWMKGDSKYEKDFHSIIKTIPRDSKSDIDEIKNNFTMDYFPRWKKKIQDLEYLSNPSNISKLKSENHVLKNRLNVSEKVNEILQDFIQSNNSQSKIDLENFVFKTISKKFDEICASKMEKDEKLIELENLIQILSKTFSIEKLKQDIQRKIASLSSLDTGILIE